MEIDRKKFLKDGMGAMAAAAAMALMGPGLVRLARAAGQPENDLLVMVFLRGGADGLNLVPPISGEDRAIYEAERPSLKINASGDHAALKLDERFGLHPSAKPLHDLYVAKKLAVVHAVGLTADTRSHFDAQSFMELGTPGKKTTTSGWITRHLETAREGADADHSFLTAISVGNLVPLSLLGYPGVAVINNLNGFNLAGKKELQNAQRKALRAMYQGSDWLSRYGEETLDAIDALENGNAGDYTPAAGADYPKSDIGNRLKTLAQLIKMNLNMRIANIDMGGWDTHKQQGRGAEGPLANQVQQLSQALSAFYNDLKGRRLTVVVMTEFGRRLKENANQGTDHGHGGVMFVLGEGVEGGKVYGSWPGLKTERLYERADLAVTTDYRQVLGEVLVHRLKNTKLNSVFPGYVPPAKGLGIVKA